MACEWTPAEEWVLATLWDQRPPSWPGWAGALPGRSRSARYDRAMLLGLEPLGHEWWDEWAAAQGGGWPARDLLTREWWDWFEGGRHVQAMDR